MKKGIALLVLILTLILVSAIPLNAVGNSEGGSRDTPQNEEEPEQKISCEDFQDRRERIRCRLQNSEEYYEEENTIPEACRNIQDSEACRTLYAKVRPCYSLEGAEKGQCFKRVAGFSQARISEEQQDREQKTRNYVVVLLYDLEERVELANEEGKLTDSEAADLINKIVEIKQNILNGATKEEIRQEIQELKSLWRSNLNE